jgi:hypothetical protein
LAIDPETVKAITSAQAVMAAKTSSIVPSYDQGAIHEWRYRPGGPRARDWCHRADRSVKHS